jgi:hypothetical protein
MPSLTVLVTSRLVVTRLGKAYRDQARLDTTQRPLSRLDVLRQNPACLS